jgi:integration host factor subunit beta
MIKSELIARVAGQNPHLYEREVEAVVNTILNRISDALVARGRVELRGFGAFAVRSRNPRMGRNPKTGAAVPVTEKLVPVFKAGKPLQALLNASIPSISTPASEEG